MSGRFGNIRRHTIPLRADAVVRCTAPSEAGRPAVFATEVADVDFATWCADHATEVDEALTEHGGVLFRGFAGLEHETDLRAVLARLGREPLAYRERSTPRRHLVGNVYTSTEYPPDQQIALHCELTAASTVPMRVWFLCVTPPGSGGATPTADTRRILKRLGTPLAERFQRLGWKLVRNYGTGYGPSWQEGFQTDERAEVERYCRDNDIDFQWRGDRLRTTQLRRAVEEHPVSGALVWFNHVAFWHTSSLPRDAVTEMERDLSEDDFPFQVYFGDGSPITADEVAAIREAYAAELREQPWRKGDLMVIDNLLSAHGRMPYTGERKIVVAMTDPYHRPALSVAAGNRS